MNKLSVFVIFIAIFLFCFWGIGFTDGKRINVSDRVILLDDMVGLDIEEVEKYAKKNGINLNITYEYSNVVDSDIVIFQTILAGTLVSRGDSVGVVVSLGNVSISVYQDYKVNELGNVPIMMYHGIVNLSNADTLYIGGNVDKDGYNRTAEAFRNDLEFYYNNGYRMIRLSDYVDGVIDVALGKSPIILTFDDGNENNFKVIGEKNGELLIDPNCAIGILEEFKKKYPDYGVTATFFVNSSLFGQEEYNNKILKWLVEHGYDVGNHTKSHVDFTKIDINKTIDEVGGMYNILDNIIPNKYVNIVALPFGSPYNKNHSNFSNILSGKYNNQNYNTKATLRVGWEAEVSCFSVDFDMTFLKRIRAYDNEGRDFDISMNFEILEKNRYISDGNINTIVILNSDRDMVISGNKEIILY